MKIATICLVCISSIFYSGCQKDPGLIDKIEIGQIIDLGNLLFSADNSSLENPASLETLDELYKFLIAHPNVKIEVRGHTSNALNKESINNPYSYFLSSKRAESVANYLINKGIQVHRVQFKGYGATLPVASNETPEDRIRNQRVEIKILSI